MHINKLTFFPFCCYVESKCLQFLTPRSLRHWPGFVLKTRCLEGWTFKKIYKLSFLEFDDTKQVGQWVTAAWLCHEAPGSLWCHLLHRDQRPLSAGSTPPVCSDVSPHVAQRARWSRSPTRGASKAEWFSHPTGAVPIQTLLSLRHFPAASKGA